MQVRKSSELEGCKGVMTSLTAAISAGISWAVRGVSSVCDVICVYLIQCIWRLQPCRFWRDQFWSQRSLSGRCCTRALSLVLQLIGSSQIELLSCIHKIWLDGLCVGCFALRIEITRWWNVSKHSDKCSPKVEAGYGKHTGPMISSRYLSQLRAMAFLGRRWNYWSIDLWRCRPSRVLCSTHFLELSALAWLSCSCMDTQIFRWILGERSKESIW